MTWFKELKFYDIIKHNLLIQMYLINPPPAINAQRIGVRFSLKKIGKSDVVTVLNRPPLKGATPFRIISQECSRMTYFKIQHYQYD